MTCLIRKHLGTLIPIFINPLFDVIFSVQRGAPAFCKRYLRPNRPLAATLFLLRKAQPMNGDTQCTQIQNYFRRIDLHCQAYAYFAWIWILEVAPMNAEKNRRSSIAEIDYARDTLFGPIPMQATCRVRLADVQQDGYTLRELTIVGEVPDYLSKSAIIRVALDGRIEAGPVREYYATHDQGEEQFKLLFENEHRRRMH